jgi:hypothetical protein
MCRVRSKTETDGTLHRLPNACTPRSQALSEVQREEDEQGCIVWPKKEFVWYDGGVGYISIPFTWRLPFAKKRIQQGELGVNRWVVGGPAVQLMPEYLSSLSCVEIGEHYQGILQKINPLATRTTVGCPNKCKFCGIGQGRIEAGGFRELNGWPDLPILCDNNLLRSSMAHFEKVVGRLVEWGWCDFNQGLDARLLTNDHALLLSKIKNPKIRLALDHDNIRDSWGRAFELLRSAGIRKNLITSYVLVGFRGAPAEDWARCEFIKSFGIDPYPMWYHSLNTLEYNHVSDHQKRLGWTERLRIQIMSWYYKRRGTKLI